MSGSSVGLARQELGPVGILLVELLLCPAVFVVMVPFLHAVAIQRVGLTRLAALHLLDVVHVEVAESAEAHEQQSKPALALIVEAVGLPPRRELSLVLVSKLGLLAGHVSLALEIGINVVLRDVRQSRVGSSVGVRVVEPAEATARFHGRHQVDVPAEGVREGSLQHL